MRITFILMIMASIFLSACGEKTDDELRAEKSGKERGEKNMADHEKRK